MQQSFFHTPPYVWVCFVCVCVCVGICMHICMYVCTCVRAIHPLLAHMFGHMALPLEPIRYLPVRFGLLHWNDR